MPCDAVHFRSPRVAIAFALLCSCAGKAGGPHVDGDSSPQSGRVLACERDHAIDLEVHQLDPAETDPQISDGYSHLYVEPHGEPARLLFVMLPGTKGPPRAYPGLLRNAAAGGYHALALAYRNDLAVNKLCTLRDAGCHEAIRHEVITGDDTSPLVEVTRPDSIENRLVRALAHLGWNQYLLGADAVDWSRVTIAGHSQGGGHAAFIARDHAVHRAVLFAATEPAEWTDDRLATDVDRIYGFVHSDDDVFRPVSRSWSKLGLPSDPVDVDATSFPFDGAHQLVTSVRSDQPHGAVAVDFFTPMVGEQPLYADVWCHVLGP
jgi:hypothetical protein